MDAEKTLEKIGFDDKESKIYLTLLSIGLSKASVVAKKVKVERRTTYEVLDRLFSKKYVLVIKKSGVKHFQAVDPKKILEQIRETEREYLHVLPSLQQIRSLPNKTLQIDILHGRDGLRTLHSDILSTKKILYNFGGFSQYDKIDNLLWKQCLRDMEKSGIKEFVIFFQREIQMKTSTGTYRIIKKLSPLPTSFAVYGDTVAMTIFSKTGYSIIRIKNKDYAKTNRKYFMQYWRQAKQLR